MTRKPIIMIIPKKNNEFCLLLLFYEHFNHLPENKIYIHPMSYSNSYVPESLVTRKKMDSLLHQVSR